MISQNIEISCIREYVKIELKFHGNFSFFDNGLKTFLELLKIYLSKISQQNHF